MKTWIIRVPDTGKPHPRLLTADPRHIILVNAATRLDAERLMRRHLGGVKGVHWDSLTSAAGALNKTLSDPYIKGISHIISATGGIERIEG